MSLTLIIIAVTAVVSFAGFSNANLVQKLALWPPAITRGHEYWRLATCGLVHADTMHLLFNMITLYFFGRAMEGLYVARVGAAGYVLFYVGALVVSSLPSWLAHRNDSRYLSLGASGAVSAILFAFILVQPWAMIIVFVLPVPAVLYAIVFVGYSIWMDRRATDRTNHNAHLWGAAYGIVVTVLIEPRIVGVFLDRLTHPTFGL